MADELISTGDIEVLLHLSRSRVDQITRMPGFPAPMGRLMSGRVWLRSDVLLWRRQYRDVGLRLPASLEHPDQGV